MSEKIDRREKAADLMFKIATGAIVLSVTFKEMLIGEEPIDLFLLNHAWIAFGITCFARIFTLFAMNMVENKIKENPDFNFKSVGYHFILHIVMASSFGYGFASLIIFAISNNN